MSPVSPSSPSASVGIADRPAPAVATTSTRTMWAKVDTGFWVAHRAGEYFGCVDQVAGGYVARDAHGIPIGRYDALETAKSSLRSTMDPLNIARRRRAERVSLAAATAVGVTALGFALTAGALAPFL